MIDSTLKDEMSSQDLRWIFGILFLTIITLSAIAFCVVKLAIFYLASYITIKSGCLLSLLVFCYISFLSFSKNADFNRPREGH